MAFKKFTIDNNLSVTVYKRRVNRSLRLSITSNGDIRVSIPTWAPYASGLSFAVSKLDWIKAQPRRHPTLLPDQAIGKAHHLRFIADSMITRTSSRVSANDIRITHPAADHSSSPSVQKIATVASIKALRQQAENLLPQRLSVLASQHGFVYRSVSIRQLKSRWGSCDQHSAIVLNLFLMQLPWECIDYVLIHELVHTKVMRHGPDFWAAMNLELKNVSELRRQIREYQPVLHGSVIPAVA